MNTNDDGIFTLSERTIPKYTVMQAVASARRRLDQIGMKQMCMDALYHPRRLEYTDKITLVRLNEISDRIYDDSIYYYNGPPLKRPRPQRLSW